MECEILQSPMISYRSLLYSTTILYDNLIVKELTRINPWLTNRNIKEIAIDTSTVVSTKIILTMETFGILLCNLTSVYFRLQGRNKA